jgi:hypothetical protein
MSMDRGPTNSRAPWTGLIPLRGRPNLSHWLLFGRPRRTSGWEGGAHSSNGGGVTRVRLADAMAHRRSPSVSGEVEAEAVSSGEHLLESRRQRGSGAMMIGDGHQRSSVRRRFEARLLASDDRGGREEDGDLILAFTGWREVVESASIGVEGRLRVEFVGAALRVRRGEGTVGSLFERWSRGS